MQHDAHTSEKHHHAVQFYGSDSSLFATVAGFLSEGLINGQPAIVIATPRHRQAIDEHLAGRLIDCRTARREGQLVMLDAEETLELFMVGDDPHAALFETNVGRLIEQTVNGRPHTTVRAYGEMVDVLWKQERVQAAINLEILWNKLAMKFDFALLCGYAMGSFQADPAAGGCHGAPHPRRRHEHRSISRIAA
ncbi:MAG: MEDS domain-containing protein [Acidobacteria bacterium]|nr:MEDS domain-containing protein [Acidobacteriota bacterium]